MRITHGIKLGALVGGVALGACGSDRGAVPTEPLAEASALARADASIASRLEAVGESRGWVRDGSQFTSPGWRAAGGNRWELLGARVSARADEGYEVGVGQLARSRIKLVPIGARPSEGRLDGGRLVYAGYARDVDRIVTSTRHTARSLVHAPDLRVLLVAMRAGATMAEHAAATSVTVNVVSGALQMKVRGETIDLAEAHFVRIEPGERHDVVATTDAAFVLTLGHTASGTAPSPVMDVPPCE